MNKIIEDTKFFLCKIQFRYVEFKLIFALYMKDIVIVGSSGFAKEVAFLIKEINRNEPTWNFLGYINSNVGEFNGEFQVYNNDHWLSKLTNQIAVVIGIGSPQIIESMHSKLIKNKNLTFPNLIHPNVVADWENIQLGYGNIICSGNNLTTDIKIGNFNLFNLDCTVGHDVEIGDFNTFNPSTNVSGCVKIENTNMFGTGAAILERLEIKSNITIGAGGLVTKNIQESGVYVGCPAKKIK